MQSCIQSGKDWLDTNGNLLEAHDAGMLKVRDTYYLYGVDRTRNSSLYGNDKSFYQLNMYSSKDLVTWEFENHILTKSAGMDLTDPGILVERPKIVYNPNLDKYVMWFHYDRTNYGLWKLGVAYCDTVNGDYTYVGLADVKRRNKDEAQSLADMTLFVDDDGKGYLAATGDGYMHIFLLNDDFLSVKEWLPDPANIAGTRVHGEAPSLFKRNGKYYMICSDFSGWSDNDNFFVMADDLNGPWTNAQLIAEKGTNTYNSQNTYTMVIEGTKQTTYLYMGDRWKNGTVASRYVWLPLQFSNDRLCLQYCTEWKLDAVTGEYDMTV